MLWPDDILQEMDLWATIWRLQGKRTCWMQGVDDALKFIEEGGGVNCYVGTTLAKQAGTARQRITKKTSSGMVGLWSDIDVSGGPHQKPNLPPTLEDGVALLDELPMRPTVVIHSGHGLQAWWLFHEPFTFDIEDEQIQGMRLAYGWGRLIQGTAARHGWLVDSVHDLARVMRIPGTINQKKGQEPKQATIINADGPRFDLSEFETFEATPTPPKVKPPEIKISSQAPMDKIEAMITNDDMFRMTYNRKREDLADQSPSGYDMSLANQMVQAGWTDEEVAATLSHVRRTNGDDMKRPDYYSRTIARARQDIVKDAAAVELSEMATVGSDGHEIDRDEALARLSGLFGITFHRIERIGGAGVEPVYTLNTDKGGITLGGISTVMRQDTFRARIAAATSVVPRRVGKKDKVTWDNVATIILAACEDVKSDDAADVHLSSALDRYLEKNPPSADLDHAVSIEKPILHDDRPAFFLSDFRKFLRYSLGDNVSPKLLGMALRAAGIERKRIRHNGKVPYVYVLPVP